MKLILRRSTLAVLICGLQLAIPCAAQDNPFGGVGDANPFGAAPPAKDANDAALVQQARQGETTKAPESDPILLAIQESNPTSPEQLVRAAKWLIRLGRQQDARPYLQRTIDARPERPVLFQLQQTFGSSFFLEMRRDPQLAPEGDELGRAVLIAAHEAVRDAGRLAALTEQLKSDQPPRRRAAIVDLRDAGSDAAAFLLETLANPAKADQHAAIAAALPQLGDHAVPILIAALEAPQPAFRIQVMGILARFGQPDSAAYLLYPALAADGDPEQQRAAAAALQAILGGVPNRESAVRHLRYRVDRLLRGERPLGVSSHKNATLWSWNDQLRAPQATPVTTIEAAAAHAARLSDDLYRLAPGDSSDQQRFALGQLAASEVAAVNGIDFDAQRLAGLPLEVIQSALDQAMQHDLVPAAVAAARELGARGGPEQLDSVQGQPSLLVQAAMHGDLRLRNAALRAIMDIGPVGPYAGSSRVLEALQQLISASGQQRALVGDPNGADGPATAALFSSQGISGEWVARGRDLFRRAAQRGDYDVVLISDAIDSPNAMETLQWLRRDPRTAGLRVIIMARADQASEAVFNRSLELQDSRDELSKARRAARLGVVRELTKLEDWDELSLTEAERELKQRHAEFLAKEAAEARKSPTANVTPTPEAVVAPVEKRSTLSDRFVPYDGLFRAQAIASDDPLTWALVRPHGDSDIARIVELISEDRDPSWPDAQQRLEQAAHALQWLAAAEQEGQGKVYDLFRCESAAIEALWTPQLTASAAPLVGRLGSHRCQKALIELASDGGLPVSARQAALAGFREAIAHRGLMLTRQELLDQYERYNASEKLDRDTQRILGELLDIIETPSRTGGP